MHKLDFVRNLLLSAALLVAVAEPILFGQVNTTPSHSENKALIAPTFDVASIKPNKSGSSMSTGYNPSNYSRFTYTNVTLQELIRTAYEVRNDQISGGPNWINSEKYDIEAKGGKPLADEMEKLSLYQRMRVTGRMLQPLLEDRFQLKYHHETKELPVYLLVVTKAGKLHEAEGDCGPPPQFPPPKTETNKPHAMPCGGFFVLGRHIGGQKVSVTQLVDILSRFITDRVVVDKTGLTGRYDINLDWSSESSQVEESSGGPRNGLPPSAEFAIDPSFFTVIQQQLGLKLKSQKGPVEILVIDHVGETFGELVAVVYLMI